MSADQSIDETVTRSDLVHERLRESPVKRWILLDGNRYLLTALFAVVVFGIVAGIGFTGFIPVTDPGTATTLVGAIVGGTLPFITIVLAINQLVLSQELGWPGDLADRFEGMAGFRREVEELTGVAVSPAAPADFLQLLVGRTVENAAVISRTAPRVADDGVSALLEDVADAITTEGQVVSDALEGADFGTFETLSAVLGRFNGAHLYAVRTLLAHHGDELPREGTRALEQLVVLLGHLAVARQSFKTLYMQHELAHLSKLLLYVGFPTLLGGGVFMMTYPRIVEAVSSQGALVVLVAAVVTVAFFPFVVLLVYTFRIASVAARTADFGPFVPRVDFEEGLE